MDIDCNFLQYYVDDKTAFSESKKYVTEKIFIGGKKKNEKSVGKSDLKLIKLIISCNKYLSVYILFYF